jgi:hypothetical protein
VLQYDTTRFFRDFNNVVNYSLGVVDGIHKGKQVFLHRLGAQTIEAMKQFVDSNARVNPEALHHIYEWHQTGSPNARLFDLEYTVSNLGLSIKSSLSQSKSVQNGSNVPFYDKARIMEEGIPVRIKATKAKVLSFNVDGEQVFTNKEVYVENPGGDLVEGSLERALDSFMTSYFTQAFMYNIGIQDNFSNTNIYKKNFRSGILQGKSAGVLTGYRWITNLARGEE